MFLLHCSKDVSQERMIELGESNPDYMPSALLSRSIAKYNQNLKDLLTYFRAETNLHEVNTEQTFKQSFASLCAVVEPTIINVRCSGSDEA